MRLAVVILLAFVHVLTPAQQYNSYSFNELYHFSENTIYDISQDEKGYFWLGTSNGLFQFNGNDFTNYQYPDFAKEYTNIKIDKKGQVWFLNFGGQVFYLKQNIPTLFTDFESEGNFVQDYFFEEDSSILFFKQEGEVVYRNKMDSSTPQALYQTNDNYKIISCKQNGTTLLLYTIGRANLSDGSKPLRVVELNTLSKQSTIKKEYTIPKNNNSLMVIHEKDKSFLLNTSQFIKLYELNESLSLVLEISTESVSGINGLQFTNDQYWLLTKNGLLVYDSSGTLKNHSFKHYSISTIFRDIENNLWGCSLNKGIEIISNQSIRSQKLIGTEVLHTTYTENGNSFYSDYDGHFYQLKPNGEVLQINHPEIVKTHFSYNQKDGFIYFDHSNHAYNTTTQTFEKIDQPIVFKDITPLNKNVAVITTSVKSALMYKNRSNLITINDLYHLGIDIGTEQHFPEIRNKRCTKSVAVQGKSQFYIAYIDGLYGYSNNQNPVEILFEGSPILVTEMITDNSGIWVTTKNNQVLFINKNKVIKHFQLNQSYHNLILQDAFLYLINKESISRLNINNGHIDTFGVEDGLLNEPILNAFIHNDTLQILSAHHVQQLPCNYKKPEGHAPQVFISGIRVNNNDRNLKELQLNYNENNLTIVFHGMSISSRKKQVFEYRLNHSESWTTTLNSAPFAQFNNLAPGFYTFELRCKGIDGQYSEIRSINFSVLPHFTQTWWFISILVLSVIAIVFGLMRWRMRMVTQKNKLKHDQNTLKKDLYKSKIAAIRSQMNPHFMFNALNTIQQFIIANQQDIASEYLADFADLMRKYLDQSKSESIQLSEEMDTLNIYLRLEQLRYNHELNFSITSDPNISISHTYIPVMLIQPFVENGIKHGLLHKEGMKQLSIHFSREENQIVCTIIDNGIGRKASGEINAAKKIRHTSFATSAIDERVKLVNKGYSGQLSIEIEDLYENQKASGTKVILRITPESL